MNELERRVFTLEVKQSNLKRKVTKLAKRIRAIEPFAKAKDRDELLDAMEEFVEESRR